MGSVEGGTHGLPEWREGHTGSLEGGTYGSPGREGGMHGCPGSRCAGVPCRGGPWMMGRMVPWSAERTGALNHHMQGHLERRVLGHPGSWGA